MYTLLNLLSVRQVYHIVHMSGTHCIINFYQLYIAYHLVYMSVTHCSSNLRVTVIAINFMPVLIIFTGQFRQHNDISHSASLAQIEPSILHV